ncbi:hypothetical protein [Sinorhizobium sp. BJ1]|uniref:hypothetical protein n=1 Tax=Sinorhizobium sp. BJ1 TaxID=2035455 RepID=UPI0015CF4B24|nr:hypothetical protein [Sinorhizobium sp. BJ1]
MILRFTIPRPTPLSKRLGIDDLALPRARPNIRQGRRADFASPPRALIFDKRVACVRLPEVLGEQCPRDGPCFGRRLDAVEIHLSESGPQRFVHAFDPRTCPPPTEPFMDLVQEKPMPGLIHRSDLNDDILDRKQAAVLQADSDVVSACLGDVPAESLANRIPCRLLRLASSALDARLVAVDQESECAALLAGHPGSV